MVLALEQRLGGDLVSIETEEEWNFINDEIQRRNTTNYDNKWSIGLTKKRPGIGAGWVEERWLFANGEKGICKWGKGKPRGEYEGTFIYKQFNNGERGVFGSDNSAILRAAYRISKGKFLFVSSFCVIIIIIIIIIIVTVFSKLKGTRGA